MDKSFVAFIKEKISIYSSRSGILNIILKIIGQSIEPRAFFHAYQMGQQNNSKVGKICIFTKMVRVPVLITVKRTERKKNNNIMI